MTTAGYDPDELVTIEEFIDHVRARSERRTAELRKESGYVALTAAIEIGCPRCFGGPYCRSNRGHKRAPHRARAAYQASVKAGLERLDGESA